MIERAAAQPLRVLAVANWALERVPTAWASQRLEALRRAGCEVDLLEVDCIGSRRGFLRLWRGLDERLRHATFDVVAPLYGSLTGLVCALQRRVPCVVSFAGSDLNGTRSPRGHRTIPSLGSIVFSQLAASLAAGVSVRNPRMRDALWWPPARRRTAVIPSGVDTRRFRPRPRAGARIRRGLPIEGARVLFVARDAEERPQKRLDLARRAVTLLGDGVVLDVASRVPFDEMADAYSAADAFLLTSFEEGSPNCIKEALACAVPVVTAAVGDAPQVVEGLTNCHVVAPTPQTIAVALGRVIRDGRGCPEGPARMAARYSVEAMTAEFVALYKRSRMTS